MFCHLDQIQSRTYIDYRERKKMARRRDDLFNKPYVTHRRAATQKAIERSEGRMPSPETLIRDDVLWSLTYRVYCADCKKVKGSKQTNVYYPERPCSNCGSTKTILRDVDDNKIAWEKWVGIQNERFFRSQYDLPEVDYPNDY